MKFLGDAGALGQAFFESELHLAGESRHPEAENAEDGQPKEQNASNAEPAGLPEQGFDFERQNGFRAVPDTIAITREHAKPIMASGEVGVQRLATTTTVPSAFVILSSPSQRPVC